MINSASTNPTYLNQVYEYRSFVIVSATISALVSAIFAALAILNIFTLGSALIAGGAGLSALVLIALYCLKQPPIAINTTEDFNFDEVLSNQLPQPISSTHLEDKTSDRLLESSLTILDANNSERPLPSQLKKRKFKKTEKPPELSIEVLPHELLAHIFSFLSFRDCGSSQLVCRRWAACISEPTVQSQVIRLRWPSLAIPRNCDKNVLKDLKNDHLGAGFVVAHKPCGVIEDKVGRILTGHSLVCSNFNKFFIYDLKLKTERVFEHNKYQPIFKMDLDRDILVTASRIEVKVWNIHTGELLKSHRVDKTLFDVKIHNKIVYLNSNDSIDCWDFQKEVYSQYFSLEPLEREQKSFLPKKILLSEEYFFSTTDNGSIMIFNAKTKEHIRNLKGHKKSITCLAAQDNILISGSLDKSIIIWDITTGKIQQEFIHKGSIESVAIQGDLLITGTISRGFKIWSLKMGKCLLTKDVSAGVVGIQGDIVFASNLGNSTTIWDLKRELPYLY